MSNRFMIINGLRLAMLLVFVLSSSTVLRGVALAVLVATLVLDVIEYRKEKARLDEEAVDSGEHVPLPPQYRNR